MTQIYKIVLTGGPSGGKTTSLAKISDRLQSLGFNVLVVPETATMMILGGLPLKSDNPSISLQMQSLLLKTQIHLERTFTKAAELSDKPSVILCDRGVMDGSAFMSPEMWQTILDENEWSLVGLRDKHYDAVIHLVTAAIGAGYFYTLENNLARSESPEQAAQIDEKIQEVWLGHPHLRVIDNSGPDFADKIRRVIAAVCNVVGVPEPIENERKFLVSHVEDYPVKKEVVTIEQTYLKTDNETVARVRKRGQHGSFTYTHTIKKRLNGSKSLEKERRITGQEYLYLLNQADPDFRPIRKTRTCFLWGNQYFELDCFLGSNGLTILEAEIEEIKNDLAIPPWISIDREVTNEKAFHNEELCRKLRKLI